MSAFTDVLRSYADRAHDNLTYRTMVPEHVLRDAAAVIDDYRDRRGTLDEAWAEVEAALPEGWVIRRLWRPVAEEPWGVDAGPFPAKHGDDRSVFGGGPTPAAALRALARKLREDPR